MFIFLKFLIFNARQQLPFPKQALVFTCLQYKSFENTVGKGEIALNEQLLLSPLSLLYSAESYEKSSQWLRKEKLC